MPLSVPFCQPDIVPADVEAVANAVASGWLTTGGQAAALEKDLSRKTCAPTKVVSSLTAGVAPLLSVLRPFGSAAFPAWTFSSVPMEFVHMDRMVKLYDIDPLDLMLPEKHYPEDVIVPTHFAGNRVDMGGLAHANRHAMIIEDAAHLLPIYGPEYSAAVLYSFYATKPIAAGEGGAIAFAFHEDAHKFSQARLHGFSRDAFDRYTNPAAELYDITSLGWKANMSDLHAALALTQVERMVATRNRRRQIIEQYSAMCQELKIGFLTHQTTSSCHLALCFLPEGVTRSLVRQKLAQHNIATSVHFTPLYRFEFWAQHLYGTSAVEVVGSGLAKESFPVCEAYASSALSLPLSSSMTDEQVDHVVSTFMGVIGELWGR